MQGWEMVGWQTRCVASCTPGHETRCAAPRFASSAGATQMQLPGGGGWRRLQAPVSQPSSLRSSPHKRPPRASRHQSWCCAPAGSLIARPARSESMADAAQPIGAPQEEHNKVRSLGHAQTRLQPRGLCSSSPSSATRVLRRLIRGERRKGALRNALFAADRSPPLPPAPPQDEDEAPPADANKWDAAAVESMSGRGWGECSCIRARSVVPERSTLGPESTEPGWTDASRRPPPPACWLRGGCGQLTAHARPP